MEIDNMASKIKFNDDGTILVKDVRLSYEHIFEKWGKDTDPKERWRYSGKFLLGNDTHAEEIKLLKQHLMKLQQEYFKGKIGTSNLFFRNGADSGKEEQENAWVIAASDGKRRPQVLNKDKSVITAEDDIVYSGCYVNVLIRPWKQDNEHGKKINANLIGVQFKRDGDRFGEEAVDASQAFDDEDDGTSKSSKAKAKGGNDDFDDDDDFE